MVTGLVAVALALSLAPPEPGAVTGVVRSRNPGGLVVVFLDDGAPPLLASPARRAEIAQRGTAFEPQALVVQVGDEIAFPNFDKTHHNVFSDSPGNRFDLGLYKSGTSKTVVMKTPGEVEVFCNVHASMRALVLVVPSASFARVGADGAFTLTGIPPGRHTVVAWSSTHEPVRTVVEVKAGATTRAEIALATPRVERPHLNKYGEPYAQGGYDRR